MNGWASIACVISRENTSRSTVNACPPGTRARSAARSSSEPNFRISCFNSQGAECVCSLLSELLQTNSPKASVRCAALRFAGRISYNTTRAPASAA